MKKYELLNAVADAVEKTVAKGFMCDWYSGNSRFLFDRHNSACPAIMFAVENGMIEDGRELSHMSNPLLQKISNMTLRLGKKYSVDGFPFIRKEVTSSDIRKLAVREEKRYNQKKSYRLRKKQTV